MSISLIVAMGRNEVIGLNGKMPWHLPDELKYFKKTTTGHTIIMGRKTFEAIGKALPGRRNIILTRSKNFKVDNCEVAHSVNEVLIQNTESGEEIFVIGGEEIFNEFCGIADKMYITVIEHDFEGDRFFKCENFKSWKLVFKEKHERDSLNQYSFTYYVYLK